MPALDLRAQLRGGTERAKGLLVKDLNAIAEDKLDETLGRRGAQCHAYRGRVRGG